MTRRNREFFLPSDRAPAGSAVEAQLEALAKRQMDAAKVAEEAERWEQVRQRPCLLCQLPAQRAALQVGTGWWLCMRGDAGGGGGTCRA